VVDIGTGYIKAGFSGEDLPRCIIPTAMAERTIEVDAQQQQSNLQAQTDFKPKISREYGNAAFANSDTH